MSKSPNSSRGRKVQDQPTSSLGTFYGIIGGVAILGVILLYAFSGQAAKPPLDQVATTLPASVPTMATTPENARPQGTTAEGLFYKGNPNAPIKVFEFSDFECPSCAQFALGQHAEFSKKYLDSGNVQLIFHDFPLPQHKNAPKASLVAHCAGDQAKFWEMHNLLFQKQLEWVEATDDTYFLAYASQIGLEINQFQSCFKGNKYGPLIQAAANQAMALKIPGTPTFMINGQMVETAQLDATLDKLLAKGTNQPTSVTVVNTPKPEAPVSPPANSANSLSGTTPEGFFYKGKPDAPVKVLEYSDFQCPYCAQFALSEVAAELDKNYVSTGKMQLVFHDFPLVSIHDSTQKASEASRCAGEQGKFWEMHDLLFQNQAKWESGTDDKRFTALAAPLGLNAPQFEQCVVGGKYKAQVEAAGQAAMSAKIGGTPTFTLDGEQIGADQLISKVQAALTAKGQP